LRVTSGSFRAVLDEPILAPAARAPPNFFAGLWITIGLWITLVLSVAADRHAG